MPVLMMQARCPDCGVTVSIPEEEAGRMVRCSACGHTFTAPQPRSLAGDPAPGRRVADSPAPRTGVLLTAVHALEVIRAAVWGCLIFYVLAILLWYAGHRNQPVLSASATSADALTNMVAAFCVVFAFDRLVEGLGHVVRKILPESQGR